MATNLKDNERELIRLIGFFKRRADKLIREGKLSEEHAQVITACDKLTDTLNIHAASRSEILQQRDMLKDMIRDQATCPRCGRDTHLKHVSIDRNEKGWRCNRYACRRCNIEFVWNTPNNPWDMIPFIEDSIQRIHTALEKEPVEQERQKSLALMASLGENLGKLKPVIEESNIAYEELQLREKEVNRMVHEFKNHLLIEKIKMDSWEDRDRESAD